MVGSFIFSFFFFFFFFFFPQVHSEKEARRKAKGKAKVIDSPPPIAAHDGHIDAFGDWEDLDDRHPDDCGVDLGSPYPLPSEAGPSNLQQGSKTTDATPLARDSLFPHDDPSGSDSNNPDAFETSSVDDQGELGDSDGTDDARDSSTSNGGDTGDSSGSGGSGDSDSDSSDSGPESMDEGSDDEDGSLRLSEGLFRGSKLEKPVYEGSKLTLKQHLLRLLDNTAKGKISMVSLEKDLRFQSGQALPAGNRLPGTTYKLFRLLGIDIDRFERHACVGGCEAFPPLPRSEYADHVDDKCSICKEPRFERLGGVISPRKKFYYLPLAMQVELLKRQESFDKSMERMADDIRQGKTTPYNSFWGAGLAKSFLDEDGMLENFTKTLVLSIGLDGVRCFKNGNYSVWPIGVKFWNLHGEDRTRKEYVLLVSLIPGPTPPGKFDAFLSPLLQEIRDSKAGSFFILPFCTLRLGIITVFFFFFVFFLFSFFFSFFLSFFPRLS